MSAVVLFNAEGLIHFLRFGVPFILLLSPKLTIAEHQPEKVALELFIFPTRTSPARVLRATVVDFVCALFPCVFELVELATRI
jgi:hypothetical protein